MLPSPTRRLVKHKTQTKQFTITFVFARGKFFSVAPEYEDKCLYHEIFYLLHKMIKMFSKIYSLLSSFLLLPKELGFIIKDIFITINIKNFYPFIHGSYLWVCDFCFQSQLLGIKYIDLIKIYINHRRLRNNNNFLETL